MVEKTQSMKKYVFMNNVVIGIQIALVALSIIFNFVIDDVAVFLTVFIHVSISVLYNIIVENIIEYSFLRKKYARIYSEISDLKYFKLRKQLYKTAKKENDIVSAKLILQFGVKFLIVYLSVLSMLFMVPVE